MILLLTILTWVAAAVLLLVLGWALSRIRQALDGVARSLEKIAMGVRAIDTETSSLPGALDGVNNSLAPLVPGLQAAHTHLAGADEKLIAIAKAVSR